MQVDFYQLSRDPVERVAALLARKVVEGGGRLLVIARDGAMRDAIAQALWQAPAPAFLANGFAGEPYAERQPILLAAECDDGEGAANGANIVLIADGEWRDHAERFDRALLLFGQDHTQAARDL